MLVSLLPVSINLGDPGDGSARQSTCWGHAQSLALPSLQNKPQFPVPGERARPEARLAPRSRKVTLFLPDWLLPLYSTSSCGGVKEKDEIKLRGIV